MDNSCAASVVGRNNRDRPVKYSLTLPKAIPTTARDNTLLVRGHQTIIPITGQSFGGCGLLAINWSSLSATTLRFTVGFAVPALMGHTVISFGANVTKRDCRVLVFMNHSAGALGWFFGSYLLGLLQAKTPTLDQGISLWNVFDHILAPANLFTAIPVRHQPSDSLYPA